jgi:transposase InsO family protein
VGSDLLTVQMLPFGTLYVLVFISHARRELVHLNVTASPTSAWIWRQLIEATPWRRAPRYLVRDRDEVYGRDFVERARGLGIETVLTPIRAPRANAIAARVVGTLRRECLDTQSIHLVIINEAHLRAVLHEFVRYYNRERPHRTLALETPTPAIRGSAGRIVSRPVLGGLHHTYQWAA